MSQILFKNVLAVVTCDEDDRILYNADVLVDGTEISAMGYGLDSPKAEVVDGSGKFMYPGLINTHHHFFQTFVRNLVTIDRPNMTVMEWLQESMKTFQMVNNEVVYYASLAAMADLIKHGCTTVFDHQYLYTKETGKSALDYEVEAANLMGMRFHVGRGVCTRSTDEGSFMPPSMCETTDEFLEDCERVISTYHDPSRYSMLQVVVAPTQPFSSQRDTFVEAAKLARRHGVRLHTHMCEGEVSQMIELWGMRSIAYAEEVGFLGPDVWIAHGRETIPEEYSLLAQTGTGISHCPAATFYGATEILQIPAMQSAGILISLGTDGCATNEGSSMLDTLRLAYLMQTFRNVDKTGCPQPYEILKMATVNGAKTLGRNDIGYLAPGMAADLFLLDVSGLEYAGALHDAKNIIPKLGITGHTWMTMINGEIVFQNGLLTRVDEYRLAEEGEAVCTRVLRNHCDVFKQLTHSM